VVVTFTAPDYIRMRLKQQLHSCREKLLSLSSSFLRILHSPRVQPLCFNTALQIMIFILPELQNDLDVYNSREKGELAGCIKTDNEWKGKRNSLFI
jgi:hypothetical protein